MENFFKDNKGRVVIWQAPNVPILGWLVTRALSFVVEGRLHAGLDRLGQAFLFVWAFLELTKGDSPFRRVLGAVVLAAVVWSMFAK